MLHLYNLTITVQQLHLALHTLLTLAHILHGDISLTNIMILKGKSIPRKGLLVDLDYAVDLMPERQVELDDAHKGNSSSEAVSSDVSDDKQREDVSQMDKQYARGQRTVSHS